MARPAARQSLTAAAQKLLRACAAHESGLPLAPCGGCLCARWLAPAVLVSEMIARDLLTRSAGRLHLTSPGARALERAAQNGGDGFAVQNRLLRQAIRMVDGKRERVTVNEAESPLRWLRKRQLISETQWQAGERLRGDYLLAQLPPRTTMQWDAPPMGRTARGAPEPADPMLAQIAAKRRFSAALETAGPGLSDVLLRVACEGEGLESAEKAMGWPARAAKLVLGLGLDRVAGYYRL
jgi:Domain of unknown function (DUF6456)